MWQKNGRKPNILYFNYWLKFWTTKLCYFWPNEAINATAKTVAEL